MTEVPAGLLRIHAGHAEILALVHCESFSPQQRWGAATFAGLVAMPGVAGWLTAGGEGFILARAVADEAEVLTLAVRPESRRLGMAAAVLAAAEGWAAAAGARSMFLEVAAGNDAALVLYQNRHWRPVGRRRGYYFDGQDAVVLRKDLTPCATGAG